LGANNPYCIAISSDGLKIILVTTFPRDRGLYSTLGIFDTLGNQILSKKRIPRLFAGSQSSIKISPNGLLIMLEVNEFCREVSDLAITQDIYFLDLVTGHEKLVKRQVVSNGKLIVKHGVSMDPEGNLFIHYVGLKEGIFIKSIDSIPDTLTKLFNQE
jgi:hypothetical protein